VPIDFYLRYRVLQLIGVHSRVPWPVHHSSTIHSPHKVKLGRDTYPGDSPNCYINALNGIHVGDGTNLGPSVGLISANHDPYDNERWLPAEPIRIGAHCWFGMHAVVLPGVQLGDYTIVGAGAVVTKNFPDGYCVLAGNPAKIIRPLDRNLIARAKSEAKSSTID